MRDSPQPHSDVRHQAMDMTIFPVTDYCLFFRTDLHQEATVSLKISGDRSYAYIYQFNENYRDENGSNSFLDSTCHIGRCGMALGNSMLVAGKADGDACAFQVRLHCGKYNSKDATLPCVMRVAVRSG